MKLREAYITALGTQVSSLTWTDAQGRLYHNITLSTSFVLPEGPRPERHRVWPSWPAERRTEK